MNGRDNLIPQSERTKEEQREIARMGGIASGEARRRKKTMKEQADLLLSLPIEDKNTIKKLKKLGLSPEVADHQMALLFATLKRGIKTGDKTIAEFFRDTTDGKPKEKVAIEGEVNNPFKGLSTDELRQLIKDE